VGLKAQLAKQQTEDKKSDGVKDGLSPGLILVPPHPHEDLEQK